MKIPNPGHALDLAVLKAMKPVESIFIGRDAQPRGGAIPKTEHFEVRRWKRNNPDGMLDGEILHWGQGRDGRRWSPSTSDGLALELMKQLATGDSCAWFFTFESLGRDYTPRFECAFKPRLLDWKVAYRGKGHQPADTICTAIYVMYKQGILRGGETKTAPGKKIHV